MNHQSKRFASKRVADFFVAVSLGDEFTLSKEMTHGASSVSTVTDLKNVIFKETIIQRYPVTDRLNQQLPEGLPIFCFPNGVRLLEFAKTPTFHTFVHTSEGGTRRLGLCLTFYRKINKSQLSSLENIIKELQLAKPKVDLHSLYVPYCVCLVSYWPFVSSFKKFLCQLYQMSLGPCPIPIERYICNFIDDVPAPPAGRIDVTYFLGDQSISFRCPPANEPIVWSGTPLFPLLECLSPENVLALFSLVLIERQVLFVSSQYSLLTVCAESAISLLYPMTWSHAYIPILPRSLLGMKSLICLNCYFTR